MLEGASPPLSRWVASKGKARTSQKGRIDLFYTVTNANFVRKCFGKAEKARTARSPKNLSDVSRKVLALGRPSGRTEFGGGGNSLHSTFLCQMGEKVVLWAIDNAEKPFVGGVTGPKEENGNNAKRQGRHPAMKRVPARRRLAGKENLSCARGRTGGGCRPGEKRALFGEGGGEPKIRGSKSCRRKSNAKRETGDSARGRE